MSEASAAIFVSGNPDLYPLEYYDTKTGTYEGAIPDLLRQFAEDAGYDLHYYQPGTVDSRSDLAENRQVDVISGCTAEENFAHTEEIVLFQTQEDGELQTYSIRFTDVAPAGFQADLAAYLSDISQEAWTGAVLDAAETRQNPDNGGLWTAVACLGVAVCALAAALAVTVHRLRRRLRQAERGRFTDPETGLNTEAYLEQVFPSVVNDGNRILYYMLYFHLNLEHMERLSTYEKVLDFQRNAAAVLQARVETGDVPIRTADGGLAVLKRGADVGNVELWARSALEEIRSFPNVDIDACFTDAVVGIYPLRPGEFHVANLLFQAKQCALLACQKETECLICTDGLCGAIQEERQLLADINRGLANREFQMYVQFYVDARTLQVMGGEALSRWLHPQRGFLTPDRFVPLLEREGKISSLDYYCLEKVCAFLEEMDLAKHLEFFISCNFSRKTFAAGDFPEKCRYIMERHQFDRHNLVFEVTESEQLRENDQAQMYRNIEAVRAAGVRVLFDDFGMGFSDLHDFQEYPMDGLKLDKYLVDNVGTEQGQMLVKALIQSGHERGLLLLAEGVEKDWQVEVLQGLQCDILQGFHFSVPVPETEARLRVQELFG